MTELMRRRRALMAEQQSDDWDVVWKYTMGMPEDNGFQKTVSGSATATMGADGVTLTSATGTNIIYAFPETVTATGEIEVKLNFLSFPAADKPGFRLCLSNGVSGAQVLARNGGELCLYDSQSFTACTKIADISAGTWYTLRFVLKTSTFDIYLDGEKIVEDHQNLTVYATLTRLMQQFGGSTTIQSIKERYG